MTPQLENRIATYPLLTALLQRRSRRFAAGMNLTGGPLAYRSARKPEALSLDEEAALAFAACGVTGYALADLPYRSGAEPETGGGNIMKQFVARSVPSADAAHTAAVFVVNDSGAYILRRPQDFPRSEIAGLIHAAHERQLVQLYERSRVRIAAHRLDVPRELPFLPPFNKWSTNVAGSTYFVPVSELTTLYINILLSAFDNEFRYFILDDRNGFRPAGLARFGQRHGGTLHDDPRDGRFMTVSGLEAWLFELAAVEVGAIVQNLGLMSQALGIGGFPHFAAHPFAWPQALGFRMESPTLSRLIAAGALKRAAMKFLRKDLPIPQAIGFECNGEVLIKPYCPPVYSNMTEAVHAFLDTKFAPEKGCFRDVHSSSAWLDTRSVQAGIPDYSLAAVEATIAYTEYIYDRYGRFPASSGPFRTTLAYQAHRLDPDFYARFYRIGEPGCS